MRPLARGYSIHLRSLAALIRRNDDFGIRTRGKASRFCPFIRCEHFLHESCQRATKARKDQWQAVQALQALPIPDTSLRPLVRAEDAHDLPDWEILE